MGEINQALLLTLLSSILEHLLSVEKTIKIQIADIANNK